MKGGASKNNPMVIEAYGDESVARPLLNCGTNRCFSINPGGGTPASVENIALVGLHFLANNTLACNDSGIWILGGAKNILVEDMRIENFGNGITMQGFHDHRPGNNYDGDIFDVTVNRSVIIDSHCNAAHSQGMYFSYVFGITLTENIIDKNGWKAGTAAVPTMFNHNLYVDVMTSGLILRGNIIADAASHGIQMRSGGVAEDNLFASNPIALQVGTSGLEGGTDDDPPAPLFGVATDNVIVDGRDIDSSNPRGWGIQAFWLTAGGEISRNLVLNNRGGYALGIWLSDQGGGSDGAGNKDLLVSDNLIYNWDTGFRFDGTTDELQNITFTGNTVSESGNYEIIEHMYTPQTGQVISSNNRFWSGMSQNGWALVANGGRSFTQWKALLGDTTSVAGQSTFPNASATLATYNASINGQNSYADFIARARLQRRGNWDDRLTAHSANEYFRTQFGR
jgi:hypothetical protein